jgi:hypothetical protein
MIKNMSNRLVAGLVMHAILWLAGVAPTNPIMLWFCLAVATVIVGPARKVSAGDSR